VAPDAEGSGLHPVRRPLDRLPDDREGHARRRSVRWRPAHGEDSCGRAGSPLCLSEASPLTRGDPGVVSPWLARGRRRVIDYVVTYRVAKDFNAAGRAFRRGEILRRDDPAVSLLPRVETLLDKQLLLVRTQLADRPVALRQGQRDGRMAGQRLKGEEMPEVITETVLISEPFKHAGQQYVRGDRLPLRHRWVRNVARENPSWFRMEVRARGRRARLAGHARRPGRGATPGRARRTRGGEGTPGARPPR
jgi:hypothetical protein